MLIILLILLNAVMAFRMPLGAPCNITNSHLDANTKEFVSDCDSFGCTYWIFFIHEERTDVHSLCGEKWEMSTQAMSVRPIQRIIGPRLTIQTGRIRHDLPPRVRHSTTTNVPRRFILPRRLIDLSTACPPRRTMSVE